MNRKELIKTCRYYTGVKNNPFINDDKLAWFWDMERVYVRNGGKCDYEPDYFEYVKKPYSGIPTNLLKIMFTSWGKWTYDIKGSINNFYKLVDEYLFIPNDHYPEDKIPNE